MGAAPRAPVVLITGASSGIGRATSEEFARAGYVVAVNYRANRAAAAEVAQQIGGRPYEADVADAGAVEEMTRRIERDLGPILVAVCNAGFYTEQPLAAVSDELWNNTIRTMLGGCLTVARSVVPGMRRLGAGSIVTVGSELALIGGESIAPYVAAKAAIIGFTRSLARELAPTIRVNCVAPGAVDTPLLPDRDRGPEYTSTVPLRRIGRPDEVAAAIRHIAEATWTTGQTYSPNGGVVIQ